MNNSKLGCWVKRQKGTLGESIRNLKEKITPEFREGYVNILLTHYFLEKVGAAS